MNRSASASLDTFACVRCGAVVPVSAVACPACGLDMYPADDDCRCPECGGNMAADEKVCHRCGTEVVTIDEAPPEPDQDDEYCCSECGGDVAVDDKICPHCGADVVTIDEAPPEPDQDDEYCCSECGGDVAVDDKICPHCGADVEAIEATLPEADQGEQPARAFTAQEINFLTEADRLPEEYAAHFTPSGDNKLVLPAREPKVGDITVQFAYYEIVVAVGKHTEGRFSRTSEAVDFIGDVVTGRLVFHFNCGEVELYKSDELSDLDEIDWSYYVWSGPLRNQRSGIDWYRPPVG